MADIPREEWPVLIVATTEEAGQEYAKVVGISNYMVVPTGGFDKFQGIRTREVVVTPDYIAEHNRKAYKAEEDAWLEYHLAMNSYLLGLPLSENVNVT